MMSRFIVLGLLLLLSCGCSPDQPRRLAVWQEDWGPLLILFAHLGLFCAGLLLLFAREAQVKLAGLLLASSAAASALAVHRVEIRAELLVTAMLVIPVIVACFIALIMPGIIAAREARKSVTNRRPPADKDPSE